MTDADCTRKLTKLDKLLNNPDMPMQPTRVSTLLTSTHAAVRRKAQVSAHVPSPRAASPAPPPRIPPAGAS